MPPPLPPWTARSALFRPLALRRRTVVGGQIPLVVSGQVPLPARPAARSPLLALRPLCLRASVVPKSDSSTHSPNPEPQRHRDTEKARSRPQHSRCLAFIRVDSCHSWAPAFLRLQDHGTTEARSSKLQAPTSKKTTDHAPTDYRPRSPNSDPQSPNLPPSAFRLPPSDLCRLAPALRTPPSALRHSPFVIRHSSSVIRSPLPHSALHNPPSAIRSALQLFSLSAFLLLAPASLLAAPAEPAAAEPPAASGVIYPRPAAPAGAPAPRAGASSSWLLPLGLAAAAAGGWLLWRQRQAPAARSGRDTRKLAVTETRGLGNRQYLVVADYDGKKFLLGVTPGRIDLLSPLEDGRPRP